MIDLDQEPAAGAVEGDLIDGVLTEDGELELAGKTNGGTANA